MLTTRLHIDMPASTPSSISRWVVDRLHYTVYDWDVDITNSNESNDVYVYMRRRLSCSERLHAHELADNEIIYKWHFDDTQSKWLFVAQ
jgi:hypothetical protein